MRRKEREGERGRRRGEDRRREGPGAEEGEGKGLRFPDQISFLGLRMSLLWSVRHIYSRFLFPPKYNL